MIENPLIRLLLAPLSILYGLAVSINDLLYRTRLLISVRFDLPVICVGSLTIGGAGKTPHIEYLIRLLEPYLEVAVLSRGYRRNTQGFRLVNVWNKAPESGDEPLMFKRKNPAVTVAVSESRAMGIPQILQHHPNTQVVLLDDAFQHRSVQPGLNILLTEYTLPYTKDFLMPSGRLREWRSAANRAHIVVVTKCPNHIGEAEKNALAQELQLTPRQHLFFSAYHYHPPYYIFNPRHRVPLEPDMDVLLVSAIANTSYLEDYLTDKVERVTIMDFADHHFFDESDLHNIRRHWLALTGNKRLILTTEKDAVRLEMHRGWLIAQQLPIAVLPAEVHFLFDGGKKFDELIKQFLLDFKS